MLFFILILTIPLMIFIKVLYDTWGVCFFSANNRTDNEKLIRAANELKLSSWPSKMHEVTWGRAQLREYWVIGLSILGRLYKNNVTDHRNISLSLLANLGSCIMIFLIALGLTDQLTAAFIALLYSTSIWPYHVAIFMGHVHLAQFFFLVAVYFLQMGAGLGGNSSLVSYLLPSFVSGIFCAASFVSSSASRKFPPFLFLIFIGLNSQFFYLQDWSMEAILASSRYVPVFVAAAILILTLAFSKYISIPITNFFIWRLKKTLDSQRTKEAFLQMQGSLQAGLRTFLIALLLGFLSIKSLDFLVAVAAIAGGIALVAVHILMPGLLENLNRYRTYLNIGIWANHFKSYVGREMEIFGRPIPDGFRGAGIVWVPRFFFKIIPFVSMLFVLSLIVFAYDKALHAQWLELVFFVILSQVPTIVTEWTKGLQVGKSYLPSLIGLLVLIAKGMQSFQILTVGFEELRPLGFLVVGILFAGQCIHSIYFYLTDVLPSRMAPTNLRNSLRSKGIKEFSTYDNPYNDSLVKSLLYTYPDEFKVDFCVNISKAKCDYFVVPNTSSKSVSMETEAYSIKNGDFTLDPILNELRKSKRLEFTGIAHFKTMGSSKFYVHESEITSYRHLILKQISDSDRQLGIAWVIPLKELGS